MKTYRMNTRAANEMNDSGMGTTTMLRQILMILVTTQVALFGWTGDAEPLRSVRVLKEVPTAERVVKPDPSAIKKSLEPGQPAIVPMQADEWDPDDDAIGGATLLDGPMDAVQTHGPHTIGGDDTVDIFRITLQAGIDYRIATTGELDTIIEILNASTETLVYLDDDGGASRNAQALFRPTTSGDYLIAVSLFDPEVPGSYTLEYEIGFPGQQSPADAWDPEDDSLYGATVLNAPTLEEQQHGIHRLDSEDQYDWFVVTLEQGQLYFFESTGESDLVGALIANDGVTVLTLNDDIEPGNTNFRLLTVAMETTTYLIRVMAFDDSVDSEYSLQYGIIPPTDGDEWDPDDNSTEGATSLALTTTTQTHGPHTLSAGDFADWFTVTLQANTPYRFESTGESDVWAELYASDGLTSVSFDDDSGDGFNFSMQVIVAETGTYLIRVSSFVIGGDAEYSLVYQQLDPSLIGDEWDPLDDRIEGATLLAAPTGVVQTHGPHTFDEQDIEDWFTVTLLEGMTYEFFTTGDGDPIGGLFASDGESLLEADDDGGVGSNFRIRYTVETTGEYFLLAIPYTTGDSFEYTLNYIEGIVTPEIPGDAWDPDDDVFTGATVMPAPTDDVQTHGPHTLSLDDPYDWFQFALKSGETYLFESTGDTDTVALIYAADGLTPLLDDDDSGDDRNFRMLFTPETNDLYYLRVLPFDEEAGAAYTLSFNITELPPLEGDAWDPDDDFASGATELGEPVVFDQVHGPHTIAGSDEEDWYAFTLRAGATYRFSTDQSLSLIGELFAADGETLLIDNLDDVRVTPLELVFTPGETDTYLIRVRRAIAEDQIEYDLTYILLEGAPGDGNDEWDPSDDSPDGATVLLDLNSEWQEHGPHSLNQTDAYDWFLITMEQGVTYEYESTGNADLFCELFAVDGETLVATDDDSGDAFNFSLRVSVAEAGNYYLRVSAFDVGAIAAYTLMYRTSVSVASGPDEWDPVDDTPEGATQLVAPSEELSEHGLHTLSLNDLDDWFQVDVEVGFEYTFTSLGDSDTVVILFTPDQELLLGFDDDSGEGSNFLLRFTPDLAETVYLLVNEFSGEDASYVLQYSRSALGNSTGDKWDPVDDARDTATALGVPQTSFLSQGPHLLNVTSDNDWFSFELIAGVEYRFWSSGQSDPVASIYTGTSEDPLMVDDDGGDGLNFNLEITPEESGTYYLLVNKILATSSNEYWLHYEEITDTGIEYFMLH